MKPVLIKIAVLLGFLVAVGLATFADMQTTPQNTKPIEIHQTQGQLPVVPNVKMQTLGGKTISLNDYAGKTVLLNFWATWCAPCIKEFPLLVEAVNTTPNTVLIAVSVDEEPQNIAPFIAKLGLTEAMTAQNIVLITDPQKTVAQTFKSYKLPETYIITPKGRLKHKIVGEATAEDLQKHLR